MEIHQYDMFEMHLSSSYTGNPFKIDVEVKVQSPDEKITYIHGFYNGNNRFTFRYMPELLGEYTYITRSKVLSLNNVQGVFNFIPARKNNHGKVIVKDKYWFEHLDGTNYFEAGTTCYAWIHQSEDMQNKTIKTLSKRYFNKIRMCIFRKWYEFNHQQPLRYPFVGNIDDGFDYESFNIDFFNHLDECITKLAELDIQADIILFHPYDYDKWNFNGLSLEQDKHYLKYVFARLSSHHNVWFSLANEYDLITKGYKRKKNNWNKLLKIVNDLNVHKHLTSIHQLNKMFNHRDRLISHCSIQRTEMYMTAELSDTWRKQYDKPVVIDECVYEGNINAWWGGISAQELVRRFWEATARGCYLGHGETLINDSGYLWWSHGGNLYGSSAERVRFLKEIMEGIKNIHFTSESGRHHLVRGLANRDTQLIYFGNFQPASYKVNLFQGVKYQIEVIDTWEMRRTLLPNLYEVEHWVDLPSKPYMAILCTAKEYVDYRITLTENSSLEEFSFTKGGRSILHLLKLILNMLGPDYYASVLQSSISGINLQSNGAIGKNLSKSILMIANDEFSLKKIMIKFTRILTRMRKS